MKDSHAFNIGIACKVGVHCALIINHLITIHKLIFLKESNWIEGRLWIRKTISDMENIYPYMTKKEIRGALDRLEREGFLMSAKGISDVPFDRGKSYSMTQEGFELLDVEERFYHSSNPFDKRANGFVQKGKSHLYKRANDIKVYYTDYTFPSSSCASDVDLDFTHLEVENKKINSGPAAGAAISRIRELVAENYKIKEGFSISRKIPSSRFDEYLTAFDAEISATGLPHKDDRDLIKHFLNFSSIRYSVEQVQNAKQSTSPQTPTNTLPRIRAGQD